MVLAVFHLWYRQIQSSDSRSNSWRSPSSRYLPSSICTLCFVGSGVDCVFSPSHLYLSGILQYSIFSTLQFWWLDTSGSILINRLYDRCQCQAQSRVLAVLSSPLVKFSRDWSFCTSSQSPARTSCIQSLRVRVPFPWRVPWGRRFLTGQAFMAFKFPVINPSHLNSQATKRDTSNTLQATPGSIFNQFNFSFLN